MRLGDVVNPAAAPQGKPLDGVRVLAAEQMQSLPYATQLLARLGAEVVKVEHPATGESGRGAYPFMTDPEGRRVGATFLRNNLSKQSVGLDLKHPEGRRLFLELAPRFDVVCENFKAGTMDRLGLGYDDVAAVHPGVDLPVDLGVRQRRRRPRRLALPGVAGVRRRSSRPCRASTSTGPSPASGPGPTRWARSATSARPCSPPSACSPPCASATAPARASGSTWPCSTPWWP